MIEYIKIRQFHIKYLLENKFQIIINQKTVVENGFLAVFNNEDWISSIEARLVRKGISFQPEMDISEKIGEWEASIPSSINIGKGKYILPNFRVWFEYKFEDLDCPVYLLIDGFHEESIIYIHAFWEQPTNSDGIIGFINLGNPPLAKTKKIGDIPAENAILAFGNYHNNEEGSEVLIMKGSMQVWSTAHFAADWDALKSRPPICAMIARPLEVENDKKSQFIGWLTIDKWGARSVMHNGMSIIPELFGTGLKVISTKNHQKGKHQHLPGVIIGIDTQPRQLLNNLSDLLASIVCRPEILRKNKTFPEVLEYLGWCTWNGLGERRFLSGENIIKFWEEWAENYKDIPFRTLIIDDGWQYVERVRQSKDAKDLAMTRFDPNPLFPPLSELKARSKKINPYLDYLGVWHTIIGYWGGAAVPGYPLLPKTERVIDLRPFTPIPNSFAELNTYLPDPVAEYPDNPTVQFYTDWYAHLKKEGINFTKVDAQNSLSSCLMPSNDPDAQSGVMEIDYAARALNYAKEMAGKKNLIPSINCMCMVPIAWQHWTGSAVSRCSGDFGVGDLRYSSFLMHQATLNQLWYSNFVWGDWDMWNTNESNSYISEGMAICRAISGGPIYITDYPKFAQNLAEEGKSPGEWLIVPPGLNSRLLKRLVNPINGQVARFVDPPQPNFYSLWNDARVPDSQGDYIKPLVINNKHNVPGLGTVGYVAVLNVSTATNRGNVHTTTTIGEREKAVQWNAPAKKVVITREMFFDAPEHTFGVEMTTEKVLLHDILNSKVYIIPSSAEKTIKSHQHVVLPLELILSPMQPAYFQVIPIKSKIIPLGTPKIYNQMWIFDSIIMDDSKITFKLKFPAPILLYHVENPISIERIKVIDENGVIPYRTSKNSEMISSSSYWQREGCIDTIYSESVIIEYHIQRAD